MTTKVEAIKKNILKNKASICFVAPSGPFHAYVHGWFVFLKPLSPGDHTAFYNARVTPTVALTSWNYS
ncbi:MAG: hypothetical protein AB7P56_06310 [Nitrososphaeraceae archaeon]